MAHVFVICAMATLVSETTRLVVLETVFLIVGPKMTAALADPDSLAPGLSATVNG